MDQFIKKIKNLGLSLKLSNNDLILSGANGKLSKAEIVKVKQNRDLVDFIKTNKVALIQFLGKKGKANFKDTVNGQNKITAIYKLSPMQEGILFHCLYNEHLPVYITQLNFEVSDQIDILAFRNALTFAIKNHTILRTTFVYEKTRIPVQCVHESAQPTLEILDCQDLSTDSFDAHFKQLLTKDLEKGFDFGKPPLLRVSLVKTNQGFYKMIWTKHHLLWDGWSEHLIVKEVFDAYEKYALGEIPQAIREDKYEDYIKLINAVDTFETKKFWTKYLADFEDASLLPFVNQTNQRNKGNGQSEKIILEFDQEQRNKINNYVQKTQVTISTLVQGIWSFLLAKYTGKEDVLFGVTIAGRPADLTYDHKVGLFINTLPMRAKVDASEQISNWLTDIQQRHAKTKAFQYTSLKVIQECSEIKNDFFDSLIIVRNYPTEIGVNEEHRTLGFKNLKVKESNNYLFSIEVGIYPDRLTIDFKYNNDLLSTTYVELIKQHFNNVLDQLLSESVERVGDIDLQTQMEKKRLLERFNATTVDFPKGKTIVDLFKEQCLKTPNNIAFIFKGQTLTYAELDQKSNQLATHLIARGVGGNNFIGICIDRSLEMLVAIFGILKSGNAFIPLDPTHPTERLNYITKNGNIHFLISSLKTAVDLNVLEAKELICIDEVWSLENEDETFLEKAFPQPNDLAYVIYTSGSTGQPKGVMIEHHSLTNFLKSMQNALDFNDRSSLIALTTYSFDIAYLELLMPLLVGAKIIISDSDVVVDSYGLQSLIAKYHPTHIQGTPAIWQSLIEGGWTNEEKVVVLTGGEAIMESLKDSLTEISDKVFNLYGPTETTIWSTMKELKRKEKVNIGKPIANTQIYLLNKTNDLCPIGVPGELCIGGEGLARGYLGREDLTAERFIENPMGTKFNRLYKTGDLARWLPNGEIEYLGRLDNQVKVRGYRIELGEIESVLSACLGVRQGAVVVKLDRNKNKKLIAYIVPEGDFDRSTIKQYLKSKLPNYMLPSLLIEIEKIPLTPNGKLDRRALPNPKEALLTFSEHVDPENDTEQKLVDIWKDVLDLPKVSVTDSFFELGGHSLLVTRVVSAIRKEFDLTLSVKHLFDWPTIRDLGKFLKTLKQETAFPKMEIVEIKPADIPLSFAQERLWFIDKFSGSVAYHLPYLIRFDSNLDVELLKHSLKQTVERHQSLRTVLKVQDGNVAQVVIPADAWQLNDSTNECYTDEEQLKSIVDRTMNEPFDLSNDFMLRAKLIKNNQSGYALILVLHHIASDAWSNAILMNDMAAFYRAKQSNQVVELNPLTIQYPDYAIWQRKRLNDAFLSEQLTWWEKELAGVAPLKLPIDFPRPKAQSTKGARFEFELDQHLMADLKALALASESTLFMVFLTIYNILLQRYTGQNDICVGTPVANRNYKEIESITGFFVNTVAIRNEMNTGLTFSSFLAQVKRKVLSVFDRQEVPFEQIVNRVETERDLSRSPLFQTMLIMHNTMQIQELDLGDVQIKQSPLYNDKTHFDLTFLINETVKGGTVKIEYCRDLFKRATIKQIAGHFQNIARAIVEKPSLQIGQIELLNTEEKQQLLKDFNPPFKQYSKYNSIVDWFEQQVEKSPEAIALVFERETLTYSELDKRANQLAQFLQSSNGNDQELIPIYMDRSIDLLVGIMGILKSGNAYVPIDRSLPQERIAFILKDTQATRMLTHAHLTESLPADSNLIQIALDELTYDHYSESRLEIPRSPSDLIYVIYTSGTSGQPKGVMIEHQSVIHLITAQTLEFCIQSSEKILQFSNYAFDASVEQIFLALLNGATLVLYQNEHLNAESFYEFVQQHAITHLHATPSFLSVLPDLAQQESLKRIIAGGEVCSKELTKIAGPKIQFYNEYGPTETTVTSIEYNCSIGLRDEGLLPIGQPVGNTQVYILSEELKVQPIGIIGELYIAGSGLARGYLNRTELTADKFIENPFLVGEKMYRTGDLARWSHDGNIVFLGRKDTQVKIRGYRIELEEIVCVLEQCDLVKQAVVLAKKDASGDQRLLAYIIPVGEFNEELIRQFLKKKLPPYFIPSFLIKVETFPLTLNGKLDEKALPNPDMAILTNEYVAPRNQTEEKLAPLWQQFLDVDSIGIYDDFFKLGGHSLLAVKLVNAIEKEFSIPIPIKELFEYSCIADLADYLIVKQNIFVDTSDKTLEVIDI